MAVVAEMFSAATLSENWSKLRPRSRSGQLNRFRTSLLVAGLAASLLLPLWAVRYPPLLDYPDHLARSFIIFHLDDPAYRFRTLYSIEWGPYPYLGMDVMLVGLQHLLPAEAAGRVLLSICVLLVPVAAWWFLRQANPGHDALAVWTLLLSYSTFFLEGFVNFQLGLGLCFFALGSWLRYLKEPTISHWVPVLVLVTCTYLTHLYAFGICGFVLLAYTFASRIRLRPLFWSCALFLPGVLMFFLSRIAAYNGKEVRLRSLPHKVFAARAALLHGYSLRLELLTFWAIVICVVAAWMHNRQFRWNRVWVIALVALIGLYLTLPNEIGESWLIDVRVIPALFIVLLAAAKLGPRQRWLALVGLLMFGLRTVDIVRNFKLQQIAVAPMHDAIQMLPRNVRMLPIINIDIVNDDLLHQLYAHFWAYAIIQRGVLAPGLFELPGQTPLRIEDTQQYVPDDPETRPPNWRKVCKNYEYIWTYDTNYYQGQLSTFADEVYRAGRLHVFRVRTTCW
jgi:hypothetical protein